MQSLAILLPDHSGFENSFDKGFNDETGCPTVWPEDMAKSHLYRVGSYPKHRLDYRKFLQSVFMTERLHKERNALVRAFPTLLIKLS